MQSVWIELGQVVIASAASLAAMFFITRMGGKRQIAQMNLFDYVNSITVGSIAAEMATNLEAWHRPLAAMLVYGALAWLVHWTACKSVALRKLWGGQSLILMDNGVIFKSQLRRVAIDLNEFLGQARVAGFFDLNEIETAVLETSGQISFLPKSQCRPVTPGDLDAVPQPASAWTDLILDGRLLPENLHRAGKDEAWLDRRLAAQGIGQRSEVFYAACDKSNRFFACRMR